MKKWYIIAAFILILSGASITHAASIFQTQGYTQFHALDDLNHSSIHLGLDDTLTPRYATTSNIYFTYKIDGDPANAPYPVVGSSASLRPDAPEPGTSYTYTTSTGIVAWVITPTATSSFLNGINPLGAITWYPLGDQSGHLYGTTATSSLYPYGQYRDNFNAPYGSDSVVPYFTMTGYDQATATSTGTRIEMVCPGSLGCKSVPAFSNWKVKVYEPIPLSTSTTSGAQYEVLTVRYHLDTTSTDGYADNVNPWAAPTTTETFVPTGAKMRAKYNETKTVWAQPVYFVVYASGTDSYSQTYEGGWVSFHISTVVPAPTDAVASGTGPYFYINPTIALEFCNTISVLGFDMVDPWCATRNAITTMGNEAMVVIGDAGEIVASTFPINIFSHISKAFDNPPANTASSTVELRVFNKNYVIFSSTTLDAGAAGIGFTGYRTFINYVLYALTGLFIGAVSILAISMLNTKKE